MDFHHYVGIDIAKETLDWAVYASQDIQLRLHTPNTVAGIKAALRQLKLLPGWNPVKTLFCMEHTGIYNRTGGPAHLLDFLHKLHLPICRAAGAVREQFTDQAVRRHATG